MLTWTLCGGIAQLQGFQGRPVLYKGPVDCFMQMLHHEGARAFYRGILCSYLKVTGPATPLG